MHTGPRHMARDWPFGSAMGTITAAIRGHAMVNPGIAGDMADGLMP